MTNAPKGSITILEPSAAAAGAESVEDELFQDPGEVMDQGLGLQAFTSQTAMMEDSDLSWMNGLIPACGRRMWTSRLRVAALI
jgi:hypothetical protein